MNPSSSPAPSHGPSRLEALALAGLFLAVFALYLRTLSPAFHPDDSAETIACAATLSIQHPPGYPLHTLLGRLAVLLGPGAAPFDVNLLSALLGAFCAVESACLLFILGKEFAPWASQRRVLGAFALAGALALAAVHELWFQSTIAKGGVYTLNLALTLGTLLAVLRVRDAGLSCPLGILRGVSDRDAPSPSPTGNVLSCACPDPRAVGLAALLFGLGLADHWPSQVVLLPAYALLLAEARWKRRAWPRPGAWFSLALRIVLPVACGVALYLVLPLRERLGAPLVWGDGSWRGLLDVVLRRQYAGVESGKTLGSVFALLGHLALTVASDWTWPGLLVLALGWALLFRRRFWLACGLFAVPLGVALGVALKSKPPADSLFIVDPYLLPLLAGLGLGLAGFFAVPPARRFLPAFLCLCALGLGAWQWRGCDHRDDYLGWDYAHNLLLSAPQGAILVSQGDSNVAGPLVPRLVFGRRADVTPIVAVLCDEPWYRQAVSRQDPGLKWPPFAAGPGQDFEWMAKANAPRPLVWTVGDLNGWADPARLLPRGLVLWRTGQACPCPAGLLAADDPWPAFALRRVFAPSSATDALSRRLVLERYASASGLLATREEASGDAVSAIRAYRRWGALRPGWDLPWLLAGKLAWTKGDYAQAEALWLRASVEEPSQAEPLADIGLVDLKWGRPDQALALAHRALALDPGLQDGRLLLNWASAAVDRSAQDPPPAAQALP